MDKEKICRLQPCKAAHINSVEYKKNINDIQDMESSIYPSRRGGSAKVIKNWQPLVYGPTLAIDRIPGPSWCNKKLSSMIRNMECLIQF